MSYVMAASGGKRDGGILSFRANPDEVQRVNELVTRIQRRYPFMNKSDVLRELVGLTNAGLAAELREWLVAGDDLSDVMPHSQQDAPQREILHSLGPNASPDALDDNDRAEIEDAIRHKPKCVVPRR